MGAWLQTLTHEARAIWSERHALALRPYRTRGAEWPLAAWFRNLPADAYVYDLRPPGARRGWPYGVAGPLGRLYRCGRLPVFAVAGLPAQGSRARRPRVRALEEAPHPARPVAPARSAPMELRPCA